MFCVRKILLKVENYFQKNEHRESLADSYDNYRKLRVLNYQQHHGDDPRLKNLPPWKPLINPDNLI